MEASGPHRPMSSFQPASNLVREMTSPAPSDGGAQRPSVVQPKPRPLIRGAVGTGNTVLVNNCQRGNPVLQHIRNIGWEYADIVPDYQVGLASCVLFLSIRYHRLHPEYVHTRIQKLQQMYTLRIMLVMCDVNDHQAAIRELTKIALINGMTMIVAWSAEEAGRYIETYKSFEHKPPDLIKERISDDYMSQLTNVLTTVRGVNKTDVVTLISNFGSLQRISTATVEELSMCPGFGEIKAKRLRDVFHQPFRVGESRSRTERKRPAASGIQQAPVVEQASETSSYTAPSDQILLGVGKGGSSIDLTNDMNDTDEDPDFSILTEEEQLKLAMEMSMAHPGDEEEEEDES